MNPNSGVSLQGSDPLQASQRLSALIRQMRTACPDATILVAIIINVSEAGDCGNSNNNVQQATNIKQYQKQIIQMVHDDFWKSGEHVLAVDFSFLPVDQLRDCIHPTNDGYRYMGRIWYDFVSQIPSDWISPPVGPEPDHSSGDVNANGGVDQNIPAPDFGTSPLQVTSYQVIKAAFDAAQNGGSKTCTSGPHWYPTGKIATGLGHTGAWHYYQNWNEAGRVATGIGRDRRYVR
jgi:hypothetical protein